MGNPSRHFDLAAKQRLRSMIRIVVRETRSQEDLADYIDRDSFVQLWPALGVLDAIADAWEMKFPELRRTSSGARRSRSGH